MEKNHKNGQNRKAYHLKKHKKSDDSRREDIDEKPVLFQLGSIASYGVNDVRLKPDPKITTSRSSSLSLSSPSPTSSEDILEEVNSNERKSSSSFDSSLQNKELISISSSLCELRGSLETSRSQVSCMVEPALLSPSVQMMEREGSEQQHRNSLPIMEKNLSLVSNDSLFSLSIGDNVIEGDELFSYRDFKTGELFVSGDLLSFCPSVHVPLDSFDEGNSSDLEEKTSVETELSWKNLEDIEEKSSVETELSWRNLEDIEDCNISDEAPSSTQSFSYPITKKKKKKKKGTKKKITQQQQPQPQPQHQPQQKLKPKKRCSWLCCKNTVPCVSCCRWVSCDNNFSCCKRLKCCSSCGWLFCCCCSSSKKLLDDEITRSSEEQKLQKAGHKWFCCFPCCCSSSS